VAKILSFPGERDEVELFGAGHDRRTAADNFVQPLNELGAGRPGLSISTGLSMWQNATLCDRMLHMAKSIRVSDRLYQLADTTSRKVHRSLAQQVEHWAELGRALEAAGVTTAQVLDILGGDLRARERLMLNLGLANQESMYLFPVALARQTKVRFQELKKTS
jgi:ParD-like antitoxin of type II bacterial toxin-antitoxin system